MMVINVFLAAKEADLSPPGRWLPGHGDSLVVSLGFVNKLMLGLEGISSRHLFFDH